MTAEQIAFESLRFSIYGLWVNIINVIIVGITAFCVWYQLTTNFSWNRRKTTQEILNSLTTGDFPILRHNLEKKYNIWDVNHNYQIATSGMNDSDIKDINHDLNRILNLFEVISINIKNNVIDENMTYDYLGWLLTRYTQWAMPYIEGVRRKACDNRVLCDLTKCASKWEKRMINEQKTENIVAKCDK